MASSNRWVSFVTKLNRLTQEGRIRWKWIGEQPDLLSSNFQQYGPAYVARLDDATVRIYKEKIRRMTDVEEEYWDSTVVLEIRTDDGGTFIRVPKTPSLEDLYETVTYTESKVDEFLTKFLKEN
jgi:hypothetical protein